MDNKGIKHRIENLQFVAVAYAKACEEKKLNKQTIPLKCRPKQDTPIPLTPDELDRLVRAGESQDAVHRTIESLISCGNKDMLAALAQFMQSNSDPDTRFVIPLLERAVVEAAACCTASQGVPAYSDINDTSSSQQCGDIEVTFMLPRQDDLRGSAPQLDMPLRTTKPTSAVARLIDTDEGFFSKEKKYYIESVRAAVKAFVTPYVELAELIRKF